MNEQEQFRALEADELELLRWTLEHGTETLRRFLPQLDGILAAGWCTCGCPSFQLKASDDKPAVEGVSDHLVGDFEGRTAKDELVGVLVFQKYGKLSLLEVFSYDGLIKSDSNEFDFPLLKSLKLLEWEPMPGFPNVRRPIRFP